MGVRIGIRNNWVPPRLYVRPLPRVVDPNKWWAATDLVSQNSFYTIASQVNATYNYGTTSPAPLFGWSATTFQPDFNQSLSKVASFVYTSSAPEPVDMFGWNATTLQPDFSAVQPYPTTGTENIQGSGVADNAWWAASSATVVSGPKTAKPASYDAIQDQATPANDNWWPQTSATTASANAGQVPSNGYTYIQDQATPADNAWWAASGATIVAGPKTSMPDPASYVYIQDQATPADSIWWAQNSATVVDGPDTALPTTNYDYDQDQATPADIGWWSYAGE